MTEVGNDGQAEVQSAGSDAATRLGSASSGVVAGAGVPALRSALVKDDRLTNRVREVQIPIGDADPEPELDDAESLARTRAAVQRLLATHVRAPAADDL